MKKIFMIVGALAILPSLAACKTIVHDDKVIIDDSRHGNGDFCPPGQAKKGNC